MVKAFVMKSISFSYRFSLKNTRKMLENKLYEIFKFYKQKVIEDRICYNFLYPMKLKFFPLYIHSFLKRGSLDHPQKGSNFIKNIYLLMNIMRELILNILNFYILKCIELILKIYNINQFLKEAFYFILVLGIIILNLIFIKNQY